MYSLRNPFRVYGDTYARRGQAYVTNVLRSVCNMRIAHFGQRNPFYEWYMRGTIPEEKYLGAVHCWDGIPPIEGRADSLQSSVHVLNTIQYNTKAPQQKRLYKCRMDPKGSEIETV